MTDAPALAKTGSFTHGFTGRNVERCATPTGKRVVLWQKRGSAFDSLA